MSNPSKAGDASAIVIGAGPAGLMAAETLAEAGLRVTICDRMPSPARKFLMAGRGGLNLTHTEPLDAFLARYEAAAPALAPFIRRFPPQALRDWCAELGEDTFAGSSGRVFPRSFKASPLLRAWLRRLQAAGVDFRLRCAFEGFDASGRPRLRDASGKLDLAADVTIFALGGASWPRLGADGGWTAPFAEQGVAVSPLRPANCGFEVDWSPHLRERFAGAPLKPLRLSFEGRTTRGEAMITREGIEGGAIYALSAPLREAIARDGDAHLSLDLRPDLSAEALALRLATRPNGQSMATFLRKAAGLSPVAAALLRETARELPTDGAALARLVKDAPLRLRAPRPLDRAISTAGGVAWSELDARLMLKRRPGVFLCGEMLDWEAPTGGYLLQACFATGRAAGEGAAAWLAEKASRSPN